jgi:hypothetical protein
VKHFHDDPDPPASRIIEHGTEQCGVSLHIVHSIHQDEPGPLAMKIKYRFVRDIGSLQQLRCCEIINGRKHPEHGARPDYQQVKVCRQYPIDVSGLHEERHAKVGPINSRFVDIARDKVTAFTQQELAHTLGIGLFQCTLVSVRVFLSDDVDKPASRGYARLERASRTD